MITILVINEFLLGELNIYMSRQLTLFNKTIVLLKSKFVNIYIVG